MALLIVGGRFRFTPERPAVQLSEVQGAVVKDCHFALVEPDESEATSRTGD